MIDPPEPPESTPKWHKVYHLPNRQPVGKLGALSYLLDEEGKPISHGYHEFNDDGTRARLGAWTGPVKLTQRAV